MMAAAQSIIPTFEMMIWPRWSGRKMIDEGLKSMSVYQYRASHVQYRRPRTVRALRVPTLSGCIRQQVRGEASDLQDHQQNRSRPLCARTYQETEEEVHDAKRGVAKSLPEFLLDLLGDTGPGKVLLGRVERRQTKFGAGARDIDLVLRHVSGRRMVLAVTDTPCMIGHAKSIRQNYDGGEAREMNGCDEVSDGDTKRRCYAVPRVQNPTDCVVDGLRVRECAMATLVGENPEAGAEQTDDEGVQRPEGEARSRVEDRIGQGDVLGAKERVEEVGALVHGADDGEVHNAGGGT